MSDKENNSAAYYINGILNHDIPVLSRAITIVESTKKEHQQLADEIIDGILGHTGNSFRIGISGVPGVGKSTFIETFGLHVIEQGHKLAVLAIDPSSAKSKGSILGDKTRMNRLSTNDNAFIRPSPNAGALGGVSRATYETILLCEAAGFDYILVETVGVGQSEITVHKMTDFFLLLMLSGAGDELQGIKRGIMEIADSIVITKADGDNIQKANAARAEYAGSLHLFQPSESGWIPKVLTCSSTENKGISEIFQLLGSYKNQTVLTGYFDDKRKWQQFEILKETLNQSIIDQYYHENNILDSLKKLEKKEKLNPFKEAKSILKSNRK